MAVYQISKIQIRRGRSITGPGFPQLASGELGWAIDSQELYIGNGSISEGAPAVGNTKVLTSKDISSGSSGLVSNLTHIYKSQDSTITTGSNPNFPVSRTLQTILDNFVNAYSFGAVGDGVTDDTFALQRAINQLFANLNLKSFLNTSAGVARRVTFTIPAGIFLITDTLVIPSYATIIGAGIDKTIIKYTGIGVAMRCTADSDSIYTTIRPRYINIAGISIQTTEIATTCLDITNAFGCTFRDIKLSGNWFLGVSTSNKGINLAGTETTSFNDVFIDHFFYGVYVGDTVKNVTFETGSISTTEYGFALGVDLDNTSTGPVNFYISNYNFETITLEAVIGNIASSTSVTNCNLVNVGGDNTAPTVPQIYFAMPRNHVADINSDRTAILSAPSSLLPRYIPEVSGVSKYTSDVITASLIVAGSSVALFKLPLPTDNTGLISGPISYNVNYVFSGLFTRQGTISIVANSPTIVSSEEYTCSATSSNGILLDFTVAIANNSIVISYTNTLTNNPGTLTYSYIATI
jgi:Pectate lyase superfamily protein/Major tropism determinant N-terminal domain